MNRPLNVGVFNGKGWWVNSTEEGGGRVTVRDSWSGMINSEHPSRLSLGKSLLILKVDLLSSTGWSQRARSSLVIARQVVMSFETWFLSLCGLLWKGWQLSRLRVHLRGETHPKLTEYLSASALTILFCRFYDWHKQPERLFWICFHHRYNQLR